MQGGRGTSEGFGTLPSSLEQVERDSLRGFFPDPRESPQLTDES